MKISERFIERVLIDVTTRCNLKCLMCGVPHLDERFDMPLELFKKISKQTFPHAKEVWFSCGYEAFMARDFSEMLKFSKQFQIPHTALITNAMLLNEKNIKAILDFDLNRLVVSIDGSQETTYNTIRKGADLKKMLKNLELLNKAKKESSSLNPELIFTATLMEDNFQEFPGIIELAAEYSVATVWCKPLRLVVDGLEEQLLSPEDSRLEKVFERARKLAIANKITLGSSLDLGNYVNSFSLPNVSFENPVSEIETANKIISKERKCFENPFPIIVIRPDGRVEPCSVWAKDALGDFKYQSFEDIWNSKAYLELREKTNAGEFAEACKPCPFTLDDNINYVSGKDVHRALKDKYLMALEYASKAEYSQIKSMLKELLRFEPLQEKSKAYVVIASFYMLLKNYSEVLKWLKKAELTAKTKNDHYHAYYHLAKAYKYSGEIESSKKYLRKALVLYKDSKEALSMLADIYIDALDIDNAEDVIAKIHKVEKNNSEVFRLKARLELTKQNYERVDLYSKKAYANAIGFDAKFQAIFIRTLAAFNLYKYNEALEFVAIALEIKPESVEAYIIKAKIYIEQKKYKSAAQTLDVALKYDKNAAAALRQYGLVKKYQGDQTLAEKYFKKTIRLDDAVETTFAYYNLGRLYFELDDYTKAEKYLKEAALRECPRSDLYKDLGQIYSRKKYYVKALEYLKLAVNMGHKSGDVHAELSIVYEHKKDLENAILEMEKAVEKGYKTAHIYKDLGRLCSMQGKYERAEKYLAKAVEMEPDQGIYRAALGVVLEKSNKFDQAKHELDMAIKLDYDQADVHKSLGIIYAHKNDIPTAMYEFNRSLTLNKSNPEIYLEISKVHEKVGDYGLALDSAMQARKLGYKEPDLYLTIGRLACIQGDYLNAVNELKHALKAKPLLAAAHKDLASSYLGMGKYKNALKSINKSIEISSSEAGFYAEQSRIYEKMQDRGSAVESMQKAVALESENSQFHKELARIYCDLEQYVKAEKEIKIAIEKNPEIGEFYLIYGRILERAQKYKDALKQYELSMENDIDNPELYKGIAKCKSFLGDMKTAMENITKAYNLDPNHPEYKMEYERIYRLLNE